MSRERHPLLPFDLVQRRHETAPGTMLGDLADGLARELAPLLEVARPLPIPMQKARLTRIGGRCPQHGVYLEFDPWSPHRHTCRLCDRSYEAPEHDDWWAMGAQLYTAERAVHAAALHALRGELSHRALAERILDAMAAQYLHFPNRDNALGPTRPFFSTYLESIWLLNICQALALLELTAPTPIAGPLRDRLIEPSRALIAGFFEQHSNRQLWNAAAVTAAAIMLGDPDPLTHFRFGNGDIEHALRAFDASGAWYEGENYHLFAHRGLWYGVQMLRAQGGALTPPAAARYASAFRAPFLGLLPDETVPSRRDSQYRVSIRQWRNAEYLELGYAEQPDPRIAGLLHRIYDGSVTRQSDARARSMADAERNEPPSALSRASGSWRALLMASAAPLPSASWEPGSLLRAADGLAVLRRDRGRVYIALEGGASGGGHGHPDRLSLTLQTGRTRWLDDPGTGSYVDRSLFWYRSTLAHHAPLVDGRSQQPSTAMLTHFDERGGAGWIRKRSTLADGVHVERAIIACDGYFVDLLTWRADRAVSITLPIAAQLSRADVHGARAWQRTERLGAGGAEDGFDFLSDLWASALEDDRLQLSAVGSDARDGVRAWYAASTAATVVHAQAPGAPAELPTSRLLLEAHAAAGCIVGVWEWNVEGAGSVVDVQLAPNGEVRALVTTRDGTTASHGPAPHGWHIGLTAAGARSSIDLEGEQPQPESLPPIEPVPAALTEWVRAPLIDGPVPSIDEPLPGAAVYPLDGRHYVATDEPYGDTNHPRARLLLGATADAVVMRVEVHTGHPVVTPGGAPDAAPLNPLDNESADVNADGVQWYLGAIDGTVWWRSELAVPVGPTTIRRSISTRTDGPLHDVEVAAYARWNADGNGWSAQFTVPRRALPEHGCRFNLIVNERPPFGERRRGQLRLAGGGSFGYLRGDRDEALRCGLGLVVDPAVG